MPFSLTCGPDATGRIALNLGPSNLSGGERLLNVAATRARERLVAFGSVRAEQPDLSRTGAAGVRHLKQFLSSTGHGRGSSRRARRNRRAATKARSRRRWPSACGGWDGRRTRRSACPASGWTSASLTRTRRAANSPAWSATVPPITGPPPRGTATGCGSTCWKGWVGASCASGPRIGGPTPRGKRAGCTDGLATCWNRHALDTPRERRRRLRRARATCPMP